MNAEGAEWTSAAHGAEASRVARQRGHPSTVSHPPRSAMGVARRGATCIPPRSGSSLRLLASWFWCSTCSSPGGTRSDRRTVSGRGPCSPERERDLNEITCIAIRQDRDPPAAGILIGGGWPALAGGWAGGGGAPSSRNSCQRRTHTVWRRGPSRAVAARCGHDLRAAARVRHDRATQCAPHRRAWDASRASTACASLLRWSASIMSRRDGARDGPSWCGGAQNPISHRV